VNLLQKWANLYEMRPIFFQAAERQPGLVTGETQSKRAPPSSAGCGLGASGKYQSDQCQQDKVDWSRGAHRVRRFA
jgi:hypothetical protein